MEPFGDKKDPCGKTLPKPAGMPPLAQSLSSKLRARLSSVQAASTSSCTTEVTALVPCDLLSTASSSSLSGMPRAHASKAVRKPRPKFNANHPHLVPAPRLCGRELALRQLLRLRVIRDEPIDVSSIMQSSHDRDEPIDASSIMQSSHEAASSSPHLTPLSENEATPDFRPPEASTHSSS